MLYVPEYSMMAPASAAPRAKATSVIVVRIRRLMDAVEIRDHILCVRFGDLQVRHRRERIEFLRRAYPRDHVLRRVRHDAAEIDALAYAAERRSDIAASR